MFYIYVVIYLFVVVVSSSLTSALSWFFLLIHFTFAAICYYFSKIFKHIIELLKWDLLNFWLCAITLPFSLCLGLLCGFLSFGFCFPNLTCYGSEKWCSASSLWIVLGFRVQTPTRPSSRVLCGALGLELSNPRLMKWVGRLINWQMGEGDWFLSKTWGSAPWREIEAEPGIPWLCSWIAVNLEVVEVD